MEQKFSKLKRDNYIVLFNIKGIGDLVNGDIFFRRNDDNSVDILHDYEYLDKEYINSIINNLNEEEEYDFKSLESKLFKN